MEPFGPDGPMPPEAAGGPMPEQPSEEELNAAAALDALTQDAVEEGLDQEEAQTDPTAWAEPIDLEPDVEQSIAMRIQSFLDDHDETMEPQWKLWDRVRENYLMKPHAEHQGSVAGSAQLSTEITQSFCDQAKARISGQMLSIRPLVQFKASGEESSDELSVARTELAEDAERFLASYGPRNLKWDQWIPLKILGAVKYGSKASYDMWTERINGVRWFFDDEGKRRPKVNKLAGIQIRLIHYRDLIGPWPLTENDWQAAEWIGHRMNKTEHGFLELCREHGLTEEYARSLWTGGETDQESGETKELEARRIQPTDSGKYTNRVVELWVDTDLAEEMVPGKYRIIYAEDARKIIRIYPNPLNCQEHPYRETVYLPQENFAHGKGCGEEILVAHAALEALTNLLVDNLKIAANDILLVDETKAGDLRDSTINPGRAHMVNGEPKKVAATFSLGTALQPIYQAFEFFSRMAMGQTGLSSILQGLGDPTMKSGADASSVMLLRDEASKKFGDVDRSVRLCFIREAGFWMELIQQFAPNGIFYEHVSPERAHRLERIKYMPPRGDLAEMFHIDVQAPSATSNNESMKQQYLIMLNISMTAMQNLERLAAESMSDNPFQLIRFKRDVAAVQVKLLKRIFELHDAGPIAAKVPELGDPTPEEEVMAQLLGKLNEVGQQLVGMQHENAVLDAQLQLMNEGNGMLEARKMAEDLIGQQEQAAQQQQEAAGGVQPS